MLQQETEPDTGADQKRTGSATQYFKFYIANKLQNLYFQDNSEN